MELDLVTAHIYLGPFRIKMENMHPLWGGVSLLLSLTILSCILAGMLTVCFGIPFQFYKGAGILFAGWSFATFLKD